MVALKTIIIGAIVAILMSIFITAFNDGFNNDKCFQSVQESFVEGEVFALPDVNYRFIVKDKNEVIWYIKTMSSDTSITNKVKVF